MRQIIETGYAGTPASGAYSAIWTIAVNAPAFSRSPSCGRCRDLSDGMGQFPPTDTCAAIWAPLRLTQSGRFQSPELAGQTCVGGSPPLPLGSRRVAVGSIAVEPLTHYQRGPWDQLPDTVDLRARSVRQRRLGFLLLQHRRQRCRQPRKPRATARSLTHTATRVAQW